MGQTSFAFGEDRVIRRSGMLAAHEGLLSHDSMFPVSSIGGACLRVAIVIPTLGEAANLAQLLPQVATCAEEVVVSDGGSRDGTRELARDLGARVVEGVAGRGAQLNRGARVSSAEVLLFLHADTRLPERACERVCSALGGGAVGGGFQVIFASERRIFRLGSRLVNLRTRLTGCPLGDQAQFVRREAFEALGGYREWPILEDFDFIRRLRRLGRTALISDPVVTSPRRYERQGIARTLVVNWLIFGLYLAGAHPGRLARLYPPVVG